MTRNGDFNGVGSLSSGRPLVRNFLRLCPRLSIHDIDIYSLFAKEYESVELLVFRRSWSGFAGARFRQAPRFRGMTLIF